MTAEGLAQGFTYGVLVAVLVAAGVWWGWELHARLAVKLEHFGITVKRWQDYDAYVRKEGKQPARENLTLFTGERQ